MLTNNFLSGIWIIMLRFCNRAFSTPASAHSAFDGNGADAVLPSPIASGFSDAVDGKHDNIFPIVVLLDIISPSAILREIPKRVINPVDRRFVRWTDTHIVDKCLNRVKPSIADGNASPAILMVTSISRLVASRYHSLPDAVFFSVRQAVSGMGFLRVFHTYLRKITRIRIIWQEDTVSSFQLALPSHIEIGV